MEDKTVLLVANIDTRGAEFAQFKDMVEDQGLGAILMDVSMEQEPPFAGDITCEEVAEAGGLPIETVREKYTVERKTSTDCMIRGAGQSPNSFKPRGVSTASSEPVGGRPR